MKEGEIDMMRGRCAASCPWPRKEKKNKDNLWTRHFAGGEKCIFSSKE